MTSPRRLLRATFIAMLIAVSFVVPTAGWANGGSDGNGYGTHDWIIDQAVKVLDGRAAGWFDPGVARLASDDPDTVEAASDTSRGIEHVYRDRGKRGGAIHRITEHYAAAVRRHAEGAEARSRGDTTGAAAAFRAASREIGLLSHFYADILQPYHTAQAGTQADSAHHAYELLVDARTRRASDSPQWSSGRRTVTTISNIRTTAIAAAAFSRARFATLHAEFSRDMSVLNPTVASITGELLRRGADDVANIIWSISRGAGHAPAVRTLSASVKWVGVKAREPYQAVYVTARDVAGNAIEGLEVRISWPTASGGTKLLRTWTDATGRQKLVQGIGDIPLLARRDVPVSVTTDGVTLRRVPWFVVSPPLADGTAGFKTVVSDATPAVGQTVTVTSLARDRSGRGVAGLLVTWSWDYSGRIIRTRGITDSTGRARSSRTIVSTTTTALVTVQAHVQAASTNRYSSTAFRRT